MATNNQVSIQFEQLTPKERERLYWQKVNSIPGKTVTNINQRAKLVLESFIKHDKTKKQ
jgi:P pilus assembly chaperone PapD